MLKYIINLPSDIKNNIISYHYKTSPEKDNLIKIIKNREFLYNEIVKECYKTYNRDKGIVTIDEYIDYNVLFVSTALTISFFYVTLPQNKINKIINE